MTFKADSKDRFVLHNQVAFFFMILCLSLACGRAELSDRGEEGQAGADPVARITLIKEEGGRLDWSPRNNLIVFDRTGDDGYFNLYTMNPDGSNETCLTCNKPGAPTRHKGNPAWHPSGDYIVFQAEKEEHPGPSSFSNPGLGKDNDLWLTASDGNTYDRLTNVPTRLGVLHPHFSHDGTSLLWAEKVGPGAGIGDVTGEWVLNVADFTVEPEGARLTNVKTHQPLGPVFYESHGFSNDDSQIIFSAHIVPNEADQAWLDIYTLHLETLAVQRLTQTFDQWDEHAHYSPSGNKIAWMSSTGCDCDPRVLRQLRTDLWLMNRDGSDQVRLTHLSDSDRPEYVGRRSIAADNAWGPDGKQLALYVIEGISPRGKILIIEFESPQ
jgi:Tol biopolymer transport system component